MAKIATKTTNADKGLVHFAFSDGEELTAEVKQFPKNVQQELIVYGLSQKLGDSYSSEKDVSQARANVQALIERFKQGEFNRGRGGGGGGARTSLLAEALSRATGHELETCKQKVAELKAASTDEDDKLADLRKHPKVKAQMESIKAERAAAKAKEAEAEAGEAPELNL